jgi:hypothetical protein
MCRSKFVTKIKRRRGRAAIIYVFDGFAPIPARRSLHRHLSIITRYRELELVCRCYALRCGDEGVAEEKQRAREQRADPHHTEGGCGSLPATHVAIRDNGQIGVALGSGEQSVFLVRTLVVAGRAVFFKTKAAHAALQGKVMSMWRPAAGSQKIA